ncbi:MAG: hypothetical protein C0403_07215 [Desulfobacterium sp.]|nr:hypothetical protein [Desulfobacterium sp.]
MTTINKERRLASRISEFFVNGLVLNDCTLRFMESTFGKATAEHIEAVIRDEKNCEKDSLLELIFFPDEICQIQLEDLLTLERFADQEPVIQQLEKIMDAVEICFPQEVKTVKVAFTRDLAEQLVSRLRICNNPDQEIEHSVRENVHPEQVGRVLVRIRNADLPKSPHIIRFLCDFFSRIDLDGEDFFQYVDFLMQFTSALGNTLDIFNALMERKKACIQAIQKAASYEKQLARYNMEVMILKGDRNPCINIEEAEKTVEIINRISFSMFGRSDDPVAALQKVDLGECHPGEDLQKVIRLLS